MEDVSPQLFIDTVMGYQRTAAIKAAVALDLFTAIAKEDGDVARIAKRVQAAERGVSKLCDYLTVQGFLQKEAQRYRLAGDVLEDLTEAQEELAGDELLPLRQDHHPLCGAHAHPTRRRPLGRRLGEAVLAPRRAARDIARRGRAVEACQGR